MRRMAIATAAVALAACGDTGGGRSARTRTNFDEVRGVVVSTVEATVAAVAPQARQEVLSSSGRIPCTAIPSGERDRQREQHVIRLYLPPEELAATAARVAEFWRQRGFEKVDARDEGTTRAAVYGEFSVDYSISYTTAGGVTSIAASSTCLPALA